MYAVAVLSAGGKNGKRYGMKSNIVQRGASRKKVTAKDCSYLNLVFIHKDTDNILNVGIQYFKICYFGILRLKIKKLTKKGETE